MTDPTTPSFKQVQEIQNRINTRLAEEFRGLSLQMQVQRINVSVVSGDEVDTRTNSELQKLLNQSETIPSAIMPK